MFKKFITISILICLSFFNFCKAEDVKSPKTTKRENYDYWRLFNYINKDERRELLQLYSTDHKEFKRRIDIIRKKERDNHQNKINKMNDLLSKYQNGSQEEKSKISLELKEIISHDYEKHLQNSKNNLLDMKKRVKKLEKEINHREKMMNKAVNSYLNALISGKLKPGQNIHPRKRNRNKMKSGANE